MLDVKLKALFLPLQMSSEPLFEPTGRSPITFDVVDLLFVFFLKTDDFVSFRAYFLCLPIELTLSAPYLRRISGILQRIGDRTPWLLFSAPNKAQRPYSAPINVPQPSSAPITGRPSISSAHFLPADTEDPRALFSRARARTFLRKKDSRRLSFFQNTTTFSKLTQIVSRRRSICFNLLTVVLLI